MNATDRTTEMPVVSSPLRSMMVCRAPSVSAPENENTIELECEYNEFGDEIVRREYDRSGELQRVRRTTYDAHRNRLVEEVTDTKTGSSQQFTYTNTYEGERLRSVSKRLLDGREIRVDHGVTPEGQKTETVYSQGIYEKMNFLDSEGRVVQTLHANGQRDEYRFDFQGNVTTHRRHSPNEGAVTVQYDNIYDPNSRLQEVRINGQLSRTLQYDDTSRLSRETEYPIGPMEAEVRIWRYRYWD